MSKKLIAIVAGAIITTQALSMVAPTDFGTQSATASEKGDIVTPIAEEPIASKVEEEKAPVVEEKVNEVKPVEEKANEVKPVEKPVEAKSLAKKPNKPTVKGQPPTITLSRSQILVPKGFRLSKSSIAHLVTSKNDSGQDVNWTVNFSEVDTSKEGKYQASIDAGNEYGSTGISLNIEVVNELDMDLEPEVVVKNKSIKLNPGDELIASDMISSITDHLGKPLGFDRVKFKINSDFITHAPNKPFTGLLVLHTRDMSGRLTTTDIEMEVMGELTPPTLKLKQTEVTITDNKVDLMQYVESCMDAEDGDLLVQGKVMFFNGEKETSIIFLNEGMNDVVFSVTDSDGMNTKATLKVNYKPNGEVKPEPPTPPVKPEPPTKPEEEKPSVKPEEEKPSVKPEEEKPSVKPEEEKPAVKPEEDKKPVVKPEEDKKPVVKPEEDKKPEVKPNTEKPKTGDVSVFGSLALGVASLGTALLLRKKK